VSASPCSSADVDYFKRVNRHARAPQPATPCFRTLAAEMRQQVREFPI